MGVQIKFLGKRRIPPQSPLLEETLHPITSAEKILIGLGTSGKLTLLILLITKSNWIRCGNNSLQMYNLLSKKPQVSKSMEDGSHEANGENDVNSKIDDSNSEPKKERQTQLLDHSKVCTSLYSYQQKGWRDLVLKVRKNGNSRHFLRLKIKGEEDIFSLIFLKNRQKVISKVVFWGEDLNIF